MMWFVAGFIQHVALDLRIETDYRIGDEGSMPCRYLLFCGLLAARLPHFKARSGGPLF